MLFYDFGETRKRWTFVDQTKQLHTTADGVQWLSQSDCSICISRILLTKDIRKF